MNSELVLFSSESVTEGHPDKVCDLIADSILDAALSRDPGARIACEVCATTGMVMVMGEFTTSGYIDIPRIVRETVREIGYTDPAYGFDGKTCAVLTSIDEQSPDISMGVSDALEARSGETDPADRIGAGDQGMMFGYATDETPSMMPLAITLAHALTLRLTTARKSGEIPFLRPDGKAQVTVAYRDGVPMYVDTVVVSAQHDPDVSAKELEAAVRTRVIDVAVPARFMTENTKIYINPTGRFVVGGPAGDTGVTGRKIIVDTYGGMCPHGGGAFSGKDPTKVDRSASYYARYACKNLVAAGVAKRIQLQVAYAIGKARPVSMAVETFGTGKVPDAEILRLINRFFDFRPYSIINELGLKKPIYRMTTNYGHFGKEGLPWERTDKAAAIKVVVSGAKG